MLVLGYVGMSVILFVQEGALSPLELLRSGERFGDDCAEYGLLDLEY